MSAPTLSRRYPTASVVAGRDQEVDPNIAVFNLIKENWSLDEFKPSFKPRSGWWDGSSQHQIICRPVTLGVSERNIMTLGAYFHRRDPIIAIHIFSRDANAIFKITDEVDRIIINLGVNPQKGIQSILQAPMPSVVADETMDDGSTLYHNVYHVKCLFYKNRG